MFFFITFIFYKVNKDKKKEIYLVKSISSMIWLSDWLKKDEKTLQSSMHSVP